VKLITQRLSFILAAVALLILAHSAKRAATPTEPAQPSAVPTFHCLGLSWSPSQGSAEIPCEVRYRLNGAGSWSEALPLWFDSRNREYRGSIVDLTPGKEYEVVLRLQGPGTSASLKSAPWSETFPVGETVRLPKGVTDQPYAVTRSGSAGHYLLYSAPAGSSTTIDVANRADTCLTIAASYVIVRGLTLKGAAQHGIRLLEGAHHVVIEECDISGWGALRDAAHGWGTDTQAAIYARRLPALQEIVIQRNRLHHPRYTTNSWKNGHPEGPQGITIDLCGGHHVIRYNEIYGDDTHYFNDGIGGAANSSNEGFPNHDSDIYGNVVRYCMDDAIEVEGGGRNVRVWGNYLDHDQCGIASAVCALGPLYIFRNIMAVSRWTPEIGTSDEDERGPFGKLGDFGGFGGGRRFFFHNTLLQPTQPGSRYPLGAGLGPADYGGPMTNTVSRNNIWHVFRPEAISISDSRAGTTNDLDYDLYNARIKAAPGVEPHGIKGVPVYAPGNGPDNPSSGRYQLAPTSPGYDAGVHLPNFNDHFTGAGPDIGACEAGQSPLEFGVTAGRRRRP
jgi:hypothetical protein